jgi:hypothetical protein
LFYDVDEKSKEAIIQLVKYGKNLENIIRLKNKEIQRLEYLNKYLIIAQQKRDEMLNHTLEENRKLKELIIMYEKTISENRVSASQPSQKIKGKKSKQKNRKKVNTSNQPLLQKKRDQIQGDNIQSANIPNRRRHGCKLIDDQKS